MRQQGLDSPRGLLCGALAVAWALVAVPAVAQAPSVETPAAFGEALKVWTAKHKIERAFVVVRWEGRIVYRSAVGGADPNQAVHLASLSKAVTGACIATLIRDGKLQFDTPVTDALAKFFAANGRPGNPQLGKVTVAHLLTHRSGLPGRKEQNDPAIGPHLLNYLKTNTAKAPSKPAFLAAALRTEFAREPGEQYSYSNLSYLMLGAIIEEATGRPYVDYCRDAVLVPLGATGELEPGWRVMSSYGGWRMTGEAYLTFLDLFGVEDQRLGAAAKAWMLSPEGKTVSRDGAVWYGLGTNVRKAGGGVNVWHWGSWAYNRTGMKDGTLKTSFMTLAVRLNNGTGWFVYAAPRLSDGPARTELDRAMSAAYRAVKKWE